LLRVHSHARYLKARALNGVPDRNAIRALPKNWKSGLPQWSPPTPADVLWREWNIAESWITSPKRRFAERKAASFAGRPASPPPVYEGIQSGRESGCVAMLVEGFTPTSGHDTLFETRTKSRLVCDGKDLVVTMRPPPMRRHAQLYFAELDSRSTRCCSACICWIIARRSRGPASLASSAQAVGNMDRSRLSSPRQPDRAGGDDVRSWEVLHPARCPNTQSRVSTSPHVEDQMIFLAAADTVVNCTDRRGKGRSAKTWEAMTWTLYRRPCRSGRRIRPSRCDSRLAAFAKKGIYPITMRARIVRLWMRRSLQIES